MRYMLDTNMACHVIKGQDPEIRRRLVSLPLDCITLSAVTQGELLYGVARNGHPPTLAKLVREFLFRVEVLPWDEQAAAAYGDLRVACLSFGIPLGTLDMMIAAHAIAANTVLVSHDQVFSQLPDEMLTIEDWLDRA